MGIRCSHCGWEGELDERVPSTQQWAEDHAVDPHHFMNHNLNCPDCGESSAWVLTGEDAGDDLDYDERYEG
jgi:hypothetical protein